MGKPEFLDLMRGCWTAYGRVADGDTVRTYYEQLTDERDEDVAAAFDHFAKSPATEDGAYPPTIPQIAAWIANRAKRRADVGRTEYLAQQRAKWAAECNTPETQAARERFYAEFRALMGRRGIA